jgi:hypothetical protein
MDKAIDSARGHPLVISFSVVAFFAPLFLPAPLGLSNLFEYLFALLGALTGTAIARSAPGNWIQAIAVAVIAVASAYGYLAMYFKIASPSVIELGFEVLLYVIFFACFFIEAHWADMGLQKPRQGND